MANASIYAAFERMRYHVVAALGNKISAPSTGSVDQILAVKTVDAAGKPTEFECVDKPQDSSYTLPVATSETLGGVKPVAKTDAMTQSVGVDANGALYTASGGGGSNDFTLLYNDAIEVTEVSTQIDVTSLASAEGMKEFVFSMSWDANGNTGSGRVNFSLYVGDARVDYGRMGDLANAGNSLGEILVLPNGYSMFARGQTANSLNYNVVNLQTALSQSNDKVLSDYDTIRLQSSTGYKGTINLLLYGR